MITKKHQYLENFNTTQKGGRQRRLGLAHITTRNFDHTHQIVFFTQS